MQIQQLQHFLAAVTYGNLGRAAEFCNITQPAITRSIQRLEESLGVQLLERSGRGVSPTEAGSVLYEFARQMARDTSLVRQRLADISGHSLAEVRIGVSANYAHEGFAAALAAMIRKAPDRRIRIFKDYFSILMEKLGAGELDVVVALLPDDIDLRDFTVTNLLEVPGALFVGSSHPLVGRGRISLSELARYKWIALGSNDEGYLGRRFGTFDIRAPDVPVKTDSAILMRDLLLVTPMIGLAPRQIFSAETRLGDLVILENELDPLSARGGIVRRRNAGRSPQLDHFIDEFHATYQSLLAAPGRSA